MGERRPYGDIERQAYSYVQNGHIGQEAFESMLNVEISFRGSDDEGTLFTVIHNPEVLPVGLHHQIKRYGLSGPSSHDPEISGVLKGSRRALTELIHTYGLTLEVVPFADHV
jgi:hypothetical protein